MSEVDPADDSRLRCAAREQVDRLVRRAIAHRANVPDEIAHAAGNVVRATKP